MIPSTVVGSVVGAGAALNVIIGFQPDYVLLINTTDGTQVDHWFRGMAANTSINASGAAPATRASPNGMNEYPIAASANPVGEGFTIGAGLAVNGKTLRYLAVRSGPGAS